MKINPINNNLIILRFQTEYSTKVFFTIMWLASEDLLNIISIVEIILLRGFFLSGSLYKFENRVRVGHLALLIESKPL